MTTYLISFASRAMEVAADEWELVGRETHAVAQQAKDAGLWVFGGGIDESVAPVRVAGDGAVIEGAYPENERLSGGFAILEFASRDAALEWAARFAVCWHSLGAPPRKVDGCPLRRRFVAWDAFRGILRPTPETGRQHCRGEHDDDRPTL
jgi:hypothetical protein